MKPCARYPVAIGLALAALTAKAWAADAPKPASPQPEASRLADGLTADIYFSKFNHIDELTAFIAAAPKPSATLTLPDLNYAWADGNVLGTTSSDLVGAKISGLIRFDQPGRWQLRVTSNDGVRLTAGGVKLFEDPDIHGDTDSPPLPIDIAAPGWYPLDILYYEKKGTATLKLAWSPPSTSTFAPVPAAAFKHPR